MEFKEKKEQLYKYFNKNYYIHESRFITKYGDNHEWGANIVVALSSIFSFDTEFCCDTLTHWAYEHEMLSGDFEKAWYSKRLLTSWSPEMALDLQSQYGIVDAEAQLTALLSQQIAAEIDSQILRELSTSFKTIDDFIGLVKCVGYEASDLSYDALMRPKKHFVSMNYNDIKNERQNNPHWQDWICARGQDKKT